MDAPRTKVAVIGSGNIGIDLLYKLERNPALELTWMAGVVPESDGLARARARGYRTTARGIDELLDHADEFEIVFDATTAHAHHRHAELLAAARKIAIDLTPAAVGPPVVPVVNLAQHLDKVNVNLTTCGGQATTPIVAAIRSVAPVSYAEIVSTVSSRSAGPGTRQNIDEFTETTARGLVQVGGADQGKAIIILNPADPPIIMRNTVYARLAPDVDRDAVTRAIQDTVAAVRSYVPGYRLKTDPIYEGDVVMVLLEVQGAGDYLPPYAGNLDIMTSAAVRVGEAFAQQRRAQSGASVAASAGDGRQA